MSEDRYETWTVEVPRALEDDLAGWLASEGLGVTVEPAGLDAVRLVVFVADDPNAGAAVRETLRRFSVVAEPIRRLLQDRDWVAEYQRGLRPLPLGERFVVLPGEGLLEEAEYAERIPLPLVPGQAFGTGEHPTTRLCVESLERSVRPGDRWLDVGAGSGILSLVAAHLGARVEALEIDPEASAVAAATLAAHPPPQPIAWTSGDLDAAGHGPFDGIVANIETSFFLKQAEALASRLKNEGALIASGFLTAEREDLEAAFRKAGLETVAMHEAHPWSIWIGRKRAR
ncbi:MAG: 50S ribosomal protein L11 methyltransferase [Planctomycetota bacterium]|nr:50S ribosomal protein L11 methyltransferase [Planctomycetota bacterium]